MTVTKRLKETRACHHDRQQLQDWLDEELVWRALPVPKYGGFWGKSDNRLEAEHIIYTCPACKEFFRRSEELKEDSLKRRR
jgi:hypothetical protein